MFKPRDCSEKQNPAPCENLILSRKKKHSEEAAWWTPG